MPSLMDAIRRNQSLLTQQQQPDMEDTGQSVAALLRAKSGKNIAAPEVAASSLGEQQAVTQGQQAVQQVGQTAYIQQQGQQAQQTAQQQQTQLQQADIAQGRRFNALENKMKTEQLLQAAEQDKGRLDLRKNAAEVEQLVQGLRLNNNKYISDLQREGTRARLNDAASFQEEYAKAVFGNNKELVEQNLGNKKILDASNREYDKALSQMGVDQAWIMYNNARREEASRATWEGVGGVTTAAVGAYASSSNKPEETK